MPRSARAFALAMLALCGCERANDLSSAPPSVASYVGFWEVIGRSDSGLGTALEIRPDHQCLWGMLALVDFRYEVVEGNLILRHGESAPLSSPLGTIDGDTWTTSDEDATLVRARVRRGEGEHGIEGVWTYRHTTGAKAYERYQADGSLELRVVMAWKRKPWSLDPSTRKIAFRAWPEVGDVSWGWLEGDQLHVDIPNDEVLVFRRVEPWYAKQD
ncbi:MAG: hypothetical protein IPN34_15270 [Planctomycetes bacterium]|nr:hypothetical protein [Planctomycetota bacterium]